jgi:hypothetical protein
MLRAGNALRFTPDEIEDFRKLGLDFDGARTPDDIEQVLSQWANTLNDERPICWKRSLWNWRRPKVSRYPRA